MCNKEHVFRISYLICIVARMHASDRYWVYIYIFAATVLISFVSFSPFLFTWKRKINEKKRRILSFDSVRRSKARKTKKKKNYCLSNWIRKLINRKEKLSIMSQFFKKKVNSLRSTCLIRVCFFFVFNNLSSAYEKRNAKNEQVEICDKKKRRKIANFIYILRILAVRNDRECILFFCFIFFASIAYIWKKKRKKEDRLQLKTDSKRRANIVINFFDEVYIIFLFLSIKITSI